jgi:transcriptional regulator with XRE-family HTH domain
MTLKELRMQAGLTQPQVAELIKSNTPLISNYENDIALPDLEDAVILEHTFSQKIDWNENLTPKRKHEVVQSIIELCEHFPLPMVMEFTARMFRREKAPDSFIIHYSNVSAQNNVEPLI